jgi:hypothetical protein
MREFFAQGWKPSPYFRTQRTVIEGAINDSKTLIAAHPHGILCCEMITTLVCAPKLAKHKVRFLVSDMLFKLPFVADLRAWARCSPVEKQTMLGAMKDGENLSILPGGYQAATLSLQERAPCVHQAAQGIHQVRFDARVQRSPDVHFR